jgi:hypothetical protein
MFRRKPETQSRTIFAVLKIRIGSLVIQSCTDCRDFVASSNYERVEVFVAYFNHFYGLFSQ